MTTVWQKLNSLLLCSLASASLYGISSTGRVYTAQGYSNTIYALDPTTGRYGRVAVLPGGSSVIDISVLNSDTIYALTQGSSIYSVNVKTGATQLVTSNATPGSPSGIAVADSSTAYVVDYSDNFSRIDLQTGASTLITTVPGGVQLSGIDLGNNGSAYVSAGGSNLVYAINLKTGAYDVVTPTSFGNYLLGIGLANNNLAYVTDDGSSTIYSVNLQTGATALVGPVTGAIEIVNIAVPNNTTVYTVDDINSTLYMVNVTNGNVVPFNFANLSGGFSGLAIFMQMDTIGLSGNNLNIARYINKNGSINQIRPFALLTDNELPSALESASPTRNANATFASQIGYLGTSQVVATHSRQKRFLKLIQTQNETAELPTNELFADASMDDAYIANFVPTPRKVYVQKQEVPEPIEASAPEQEIPYNPCKTPDPFTAWGAGFGEYAKEKSQKQAPAFKMGVGGVLVGFDLNNLDEDVLGFGGAYVHTHVHEERKAGYANVNQGFLTTYGTLNASNWYFDLGIWGGYYSLKNYRKISFPLFKATARSTTNGWQLAPHFEVGYDGWQYKTCCGAGYGFEPFLMADWVANWERGFKEHGAGILNMKQKGRFCSLFRGETGFRMNQISTLDWGRLIVLEKISYAYQKAFHTGSLTASLVGAPGSFTVTTLTGAQNLGVAEFSMMFVFNNPNAPYVDFRYQGEFGSRYQSHQGVIEIGKDF